MPWMAGRRCGRQILCWVRGYSQRPPGWGEPLALVALAGLFLLQNPLLVSRSPSFDASVFAVMGKMWAEGLVLYRDMVDIKGPVIFLINALGYALGGFPGIWLLEWGLLALGLLAVARTLVLLGADLAVRWIAILGTMALYACRYYYGNMTEDYSLSLALIAQYGFVRLLQDSRFSWQQAWLPALTFGLVCGLRLNNGALWGAFYLVLFLRYWWQGQPRSAWLLLLSSLLGLAVVLLPFALYFQAHGVLATFWYYAYGIFFSAAYGEGFQLAAGFSGLVRTGLWLLLPGYLWLVLRPGAGADSPALLGRPLLAVNLLGLLFTLLGNSMSGRRFYHYDISFLIFSFCILAALLLGLSLRMRLPLAANLRLSALGLLGIPLFVSVHRWLVAKAAFLGPGAALALAAGLTLVGLALLQLGWRPRRLHRQRLLGLTGLLALLALSYYGGLRAYHKLWLPLPAGQQRVVDEIVQHSRADDSIFIDHYVPSFYVLTDRQAASRWLFAHNVRTGFDLQAARLEEIRRRRPSHILVDRQRMQSVLYAPERWPASQFAFYDYIRSHYRQVSPGVYRRPDLPG